MNDTINAAETEVEKVKLDAEGVLKEIEAFFEHLFHHTHPDTHASLLMAERTAKTAVTSTVAAVTASPATDTASAPVVAAAEPAPETAA